MSPRPEEDRRRVSVHLEAEAEGRLREEPREVPRPSDAPFGILVVGDFRGVGEGAPSGVTPPFDERLPLPVDRDDLNEVLSSLRPAVRVPGTGAVPDQRIDFRTLQDFHPDRLVELAPVLRRLMREREDGGAGADSHPSASAERPVDDPESPRGSEVLDRILDSTPGSDTPDRDGDPVSDPLEAASDLDSFVRQITRPHRISESSSEEDERRAALDRELTYQLRHILHDGRFRALEARWRGLALLVHRLETGVDLKVFVLQADPEELVGALGTGALESTLLRSSRELLGGTPWGLVVVDRAFGARSRDLESLARLAELGSATRSAVVAEADPSLLGLEAGAASSQEAAESWTRIRRTEAASYLGLILPRFLARLPYAKGENPCEALDFQELQLRRQPDPGQLVWGHPGILAAVLLGSGFRRDGWDLVPGRPDRIDDLPLALHRGEEGVTALPTTEVMLDRAEAEGLLEAGLIPVLARPEEGAARIPAFRSVAASGAALRGAW